MFTVPLMWFGGRRGIGDIILLTGERGVLTTGTIIMVIIIIGNLDITLIIIVAIITAPTIGIVTITVHITHPQELLQGM